MPKRRFAKPLENDRYVARSMRRAWSKIWLNDVDGGIVATIALRASRLF